MKKLLEELSKIEHGFKHIQEAGDKLLKDQKLNHLDVATQLLKHESYQARMLATYLFGKLAVSDTHALTILKTTVAKDDNWRVQEMLAKAIDHYCKTKGYEKCLPEVKKWLSDKNPNIVRAVIEGFRIWTSKSYFKEHPERAIEWIARHKQHESEYVRKSVGNALRDIKRRNEKLILAEIENWDLNDKKIKFVHKLVTNK